MSRSSPEDPDTIPFLILGNKLDLEDEGLREVTKDMAVRFCKDNGNIIFYEVSAKSSLNVVSGFTELAREAIRI